MKFLYGEKVRVIEGFYKGCIGIVDDYSKAPTGTVFYKVIIIAVLAEKAKVCEIQEDYLQKPLL